MRLPSNSRSCSSNSSNSSNSSAPTPRWISAERGCAVLYKSPLHTPSSADISGGCGAAAATWGACQEEGRVRGRGACQDGWARGACHAGRAQGQQPDDIASMRAWNNDTIVFNPNGARTNTYRLPSHIKANLCISRLSIRIWKYPSAKSIPVAIANPFTLSNNSAILGNFKLSACNCLFNGRKSKHNLMWGRICRWIIYKQKKKLMQKKE